MPVYRLSYPASLYVSVEGADLEAAQQKLLDVLAQLSMSGIQAETGLVQETDPGAVVWVDANLRRSSILVEDIED